MWFRRRLKVTVYSQLFWGARGASSRQRIQWYRMFRKIQGRLSLYPDGAAAPPPKLGGGKKIPHLGECKTIAWNIFVHLLSWKQAKFLTNCFLKRHKSLIFWLLGASPPNPHLGGPSWGTSVPPNGGDCATSFGGIDAPPRTWRILCLV